MFAALLLAAFTLPPAPTTHVTDRAAVLGASSAALEQQLTGIEQRTSMQIVVWIDRRLPDGTTLEELGAEAIRRWGIGDREKDNGVILFVFTDDRQMRIEVGYGLEGTLTDAQSFRIVQAMKPLLAGGDYAGAVQRGIDGIMEAVSGPAPVPSAPAQQLSLAEINALAEERAGKPMHPLFYVSFGILFLVIAVLVIRAALRGELRFASGSGSRSGSSGSGGSSSSSSSGFRGGGGSGGGGGASGGW